MSRPIAVETGYQTHILRGFNKSDVVGIDTGCWGAQVSVVLTTILLLFLPPSLLLGGLVAVRPRGA